MRLSLNINLFTKFYHTLLQVNFQLFGVLSTITLDDSRRAVGGSSPPNRFTINNPLNARDVIFLKKLLGGSFLIYWVVSFKKIFSSNDIFLPLPSIIFTVFFHPGIVFLAIASRNTSFRISLSGRFLTLSLVWQKRIGGNDAKGY